MTPRRRRLPEDTPMALLLIAAIVFVACLVLLALL